MVAFELGASSEPDDMFVKEALPATLPAGSDLLSKTVAASKSRNVLHMVVFLPNRKPIKLTVPVAATVDDVIVATITAHQDRDVQPPLLVYSPRGFELRLHEFDGYPDEDVPALDRNRKIRGFAQGSDHEYCLCELPGAADLAAAGAADPELRVLMPFPYRPSPSVVPISSPSMTVRDVLDVLVARHRLPLWSGVQQFVVRLSTADAARLKAPSKDVPLSARVAELGADKVELVKRGWSVCLCLCVCLCVFFGGGGHHYRAFHWRLLSFSWSVSLASNHTGSFADVPDTDGKASSTQDLAVSAAATGAAGAGAGVGATFNAKGGSSASTRPSDSGASGASESAYDRSAPIQLAQAGPHGFMHTIVSAARYDVRCLRAAVMSYPPPLLTPSCCVLRAACGVLCVRLFSRSGKSSKSTNAADAKSASWASTSPASPTRK